MKAPISKDIAPVLQNPRSARELVSAILKARHTNSTDPIISVTIDGHTKRYKPVSALYSKRSS